MKSIYARFVVAAVCLCLGIGAASVAQAAGTQLGITDSVVSTTCSADDTTAVIQINVPLILNGFFPSPAGHSIIQRDSTSR